jgi:hypothetical protein
MMGAPTVIAEQGMVGITGSPALNHAQNAAKQAELAQIRGALDQLNGRVKACTSDDPNAWQALLQEYLLNASALYMTLKG